MQIFAENNAKIETREILTHPCMMHDVTIEVRFSLFLLWDIRGLIMHDIVHVCCIGENMVSTKSGKCQLWVGPRM